MSRLIKTPKTRKQFVNNIEYYDNLLLLTENEKEALLKTKTTMECQIEQEDETIDLVKYRELLRTITSIVSKIDKLEENKERLQKKLRKKCPCNNYDNYNDINTHKWNDCIMDETAHAHFEAEGGIMSICAYCDAIANTNLHYYDL